jgi:DNA-binding XRE family transcriptional regulator
MQEIVMITFVKMGIGAASPSTSGNIPAKATRRQSRSLPVNFAPMTQLASRCVTGLMACSAHLNNTPWSILFRYAARTKAGLSQAQLADKLGTKQSVISRLEDADYEGHSLSILQRIAAALGQRIEIRFLPPAKAGRNRRVDAAILEPVN